MNKFRVQFRVTDHVKIPGFAYEFKIVVFQRTQLQCLQLHVFDVPYVQMGRNESITFAYPIRGNEGYEESLSMLEFLQDEANDEIERRQFNPFKGVA